MRHIRYPALFFLTGNQYLGTKRLNLVSDEENTRARSLVRIRTLACGAGDPGFKSQRARQEILPILEEEVSSESSF